MKIESGLIYNKVLEAVNKEDFGSFWSAKECLDAQVSATSRFPIFTSILKVESDKEFKLFLSEEFKKFKGNEENLKLINAEFDLEHYITIFKKLSEKENYHSLEYDMRRKIEELFSRKAPNFYKILNVSKGHIYSINSIKFKDEFNNCKKDNYYMDSTTRNYYIKYMDLALSVYKKKMRVYVE